MFSLLRCLVLQSPSIFVACAIEFQVGGLAPEDFSVSNLPLRGLTIRRSCVCCSVCMRNGWDSPIGDIVLQTMKRQLFMSALFIDGNSKSLSVECCVETKMRCDVKLLYDVCLTSWRTPSDIYVVVQFYPWFKFYFLLFQTHYHTLPYPKTIKKYLNQG